MDQPHTLRTTAASGRCAPHADDTRQRALDELSRGTAVRAVANQLGESIEEFLDDAFHTISAVLAATQDPAWVLKQSAGELAVYVGVLSDKVIMVLDRI